VVIDICFELLSNPFDAQLIYSVCTYRLGSYDTTPRELMSSEKAKVTQIGMEPGRVSRENVEAFS
jgi:hypothetical protein